jgi:hypothetical protein
MRFPLAAMRGSRRRVKFIENLVTGERHVFEWGGARLRIDQQQDPALLFRSNETIEFRPATVGRPLGHLLTHAPDCSRVVPART